MMLFPPEKYYEACITYNLIELFRNQKNLLVFPFSISQREEKLKGFDFGYNNSLVDMFLIQYKRPTPNSEDGYKWKIDLAQLNTLIKSDYLYKTYYCLPAFTSIWQWYTALDNTFFVRAAELKNRLETTEVTGEKSLTEDAVFLQQLSCSSKILLRSYGNAFYSPRTGTHPTLLLDNLYDLLAPIDTNNLWCYFVGTDV